MAKDEDIAAASRADPEPLGGHGRSGTEPDGTLGATLPPEVGGQSHTKFHGGTKQRISEGLECLVKRRSWPQRASCIRQIRSYHVHIHDERAFGTPVVLLGPSNVVPGLGYR